MAGANNTEKRSRTNWKRIDTLQDSEIDFSNAPALGGDFFTRAIRWLDKKRIAVEDNPADRSEK
jgi:hypothetical protein